MYGFTIIGFLGAIVAANLLIGFYVCIAQAKNLCKKSEKPKNQISGLKNHIREKTLKKRKKRLEKKNGGTILAAVGAVKLKG